MVAITGYPRSSCKVIILRHGENIRVCMGILTISLWKENESQIVIKKYLILLPQCIACCLNAYFVETRPFQGVIHF